MLTTIIRKWTGLGVCLLLLAGALFLGLLLGRTLIPPQLMISSLLYYDAQNVEHVLIHTERLPRTIIAAVVGASLAIAGAFMQALTRNPLASPSTFGINAGALFFVSIAAVVFSVESMMSLMGFALIGAGLAAVLVYVIGSLGRDGLTPIKIVLSGSAIHALFMSMIQIILVMNETGMQNVLFWMAGSVSGRSLEMLQPLFPFMLVAGISAMLMGRAVNLLVTGEDVAKGLGQNTLWVKCAMGLIVVVLAGCSVAIAGAIGFVGLIIPHVARALVGADYRWSTPFSAVLGALLLVSADTAARVLISPQEIPIGVITALIGVPFFIYIARKGGAWK
ncbi:FecCD family ABC transporter permease [Paenibacillus kribbensis]|uniref:FecCD family ABC transporter permease n=1 Tax=Paenibacillus kribbensis TaxID=172713 RepID=UPI000838563B|nr:iron ABC transporter permease [Paenibacillus kribbensis]